MTDYTILDAVSTWFSMKLADNDRIRGFPVFWVARSGKLMQIVAATTIIVELFGKARLKRFGEKLYAAGEHIKSRSTVLQWYVREYRTKYEAGSPEHQKSRQEKRITLREIKDDPYSFLSFGLAITLTFLTWYYSPFQTWWATTLLTVTSLWIHTLIFAPLATVFIVGVPIIIARLINAFIVAPFAWILEQDSLNLAVQLIALFLIFLGSFLDMLGS